MESEELVKRIKDTLDIHSECDGVYDDYCNFYTEIEDIMNEYDRSNGS